MELTEKNGVYSITNPHSIPVICEVYLFEADRPFSLTPSITAAIPLKGRTGASLPDTSGDADPLVMGESYFCKISFDSDSEDPDNYVYKAYSNLVNYTGETPLPQTGDSSQLALWLGMAMLSVLGIVSLRKKVFCG